MAFNLKAASDFWVRVWGDTVTPGDGTAAGTPTRLDQYNSDLGRSLTIVTDDGDLQTIDTAAEALSTNPVANTAGAATAKYSTNFLLRWMTELIQVFDRNTGAAGATTLRSVLATRHEAVATPLAVQLSTGSAAISQVNNALVTVPRTPVIITDTLTRPADVIAYTASDALSNSTSAPVARTFAGASLTNSTGGRIVRATMTTSQSTFAGAIRLHLFNPASIPAATNDNAAYTMSPTNWIGFIDFSGASNEGTTAGYMEGILSSVGALDFVTGATTSLFGLYAVKTVFTPASAQTFTIILYIDQS